jgi:hypothetical protein
MTLPRRGYLLATTTHQGYAALNSNPYALPRITVYAGISLGQFAKLLAPSLAEV